MLLTDSVQWSFHLDPISVAAWMGGWSSQVQASRRIACAVEGAPSFGRLLGSGILFVSTK